MNCNGLLANYLDAEIFLSFHRFGAIERWYKLPQRLFQRLEKARQGRNSDEAATHAAAARRLSRWVDEESVYAEDAVCYYCAQVPNEVFSVRTVPRAHCLGVRPGVRPFLAQSGRAQSILRQSLALIAIQIAEFVRSGIASSNELQARRAKVLSSSPIALA